ncbi:uncharacterized protein LOC129600524 [Paramacrobiotus metropolitanus]|uniref:uncharacterized protein LOC129600524 n=1 Tax=Paramacrobiotus metropolitanus TaxID=2943436 RepID=UPI0024456E77|nr:uncharacterized protein LOC129600524 [Paramacrobiotus metropolitanus]
MNACLFCVDPHVLALFTNQLFGSQHLSVPALKPCQWDRGFTMPSGMRLDTAVYVLGSDQRMRYGRVVDVAKDGLYVDLLCPDHRREFSSFGSVFYSHRLMRLEDQHKFYAQQRSVEILLPESPSGPWIWLPGEMVCVDRAGSRDRCGGAVVYWQCPDKGVLCTDILPIERIRPRWDVSAWQRLFAHSQATGPGDLNSSSAALSSNHPLIQHYIGPESFIKRSVDLGEEFRSLSNGDTEKLIKRLNGGRRLYLHSPVFVVDLVDGQLGYIYNIGYIEKYALDDHALLESLDHFHEVLLRKIRQCPEFHAGDDNLVELTLPVELWQDVFSYLDTMEQTQLRAVCAKWNQIMTASPLRSSMVVRWDHDTKGRPDDFLCLATVYKSLHPDTERVTITLLDEGWLTTTDFAIMICDMIQYVAEHRSGIRLRAVLLRRVALNFTINCDIDDTVDCGMHESNSLKPTLRPELGYCWLHDFIAGCRSLPCDTVHIADCVVSLVCSFYLKPGLRAFKDRKFKTAIKIHISMAHLHQSGDVACALWDALDAVLPRADEQELQKLVQRLKGGEDTNAEVKLEMVVCKTLCATQSADPRFSSHYRGKKWCVDGLQDLQLEKLSRLSLHFLVAIQKKTAWSGWWRL